ncbi:PA0061/PA0062 family lipoprotein [Metapseudomonas otitidis]|uniref:Lipoprotein n=1 Tax=Metapseudomonas otitidis TaxID=319939 RepID=A0ABU3XRN3_9GAMM|nr:hypothetical protein [Pseudomonas otitidis]MDV3440577.1 hypothetical protein [Pseudomonas otitidis]
MRRLLVLALPLNLVGCGLIMPSPDPDQAWIAFAPQQRGALEAARVDERPLEDDRYFQVQPGRHALEVRYRFDVDGSAIGTAQPSLARTCLLTLDYADFAAGQRYEMRAGEIGFRPWVRLYDERQREVARAREGRCGDV